MTTTKPPRTKLMKIFIVAVGVVAVVMIADVGPYVYAQKFQQEWAYTNCHPDDVAAAKAAGAKTFQVIAYGESIECLAPAPNEWFWNFRDFLGLQR